MWGGAVLFGCGGGGGSSDRQENAGLQGRIVSADNPNEGVAGAQVRVDGTETVVTTGPDGSYRLVGVPEGPVTLIVELPDDSNYQGMRLDVDIPPGEVINLDITLLPEDLPEEPAQIELQPSEYTMGVQESVHFTAVVTSQNGNYIHVHPTWTVETEGDRVPIGVVSREGIFIGTSPGVGKVVVQVGELKAEAKVTVVADDELARIVMVPTWGLYLQGGQEQLLLAFGVNGAGQMLPGFAPEWNVDPAGLGTLTPVTGLSKEELEQLLAGYGVEPPFWTEPNRPDDPTVAQERKATSRHIEVLPEAVSVQRFTAGNSSGQGKVSVSFGGQTASLEVQVQSRGTLKEVSLEPKEVKVAVGRTANFFAVGLNEEGQPISGLSFEWKLANGLGELHEIYYFYDGTVNPPLSDPNCLQPQTGNRCEDPSTGEEPPGTGDDEVIMPPDPVPPIRDDGSSGRAFTAQTEGQDQLTVTVHDPLTNVTLQATADIVVTPVPLLEKVTLYPEEATVTTGEELYLSAQALDGAGEPVGAEFEWAITEGLGILQEAPLPLLDGGVRPPAARCVWPWPPEGYDARILVAADHAAEGVVTVTAYQRKEGEVRQASAEAKIRVVEE
jgi:hypothetical protein